MKQKIIIKEFSELSNIELYEILKAREKVFLLEQGIVCQDIDDVDYHAVHFAMFRGNEVLAYCRIYEYDLRTEYKWVASEDINEHKFDYSQQIADSSSKISLNTSDFDVIKIGRVLTTIRHKGLGTKLMSAVFEYIRTNYPKKQVFVSGQVESSGFYKTLGFNQISSPYLEEKVPHIAMIRQL